MPKIFTTTKHKKPLQLTIDNDKSGPSARTASSNFGKAKNSLTNQERKEDLGMFHINRNKRPSLPSLSTLLSSEIDESEEPEPQTIVKNYGKKDTFIKDSNTSLINNSSEKQNEFDISHMFDDGLSDEENIEEFGYVSNSQDSDTEAMQERRKKRNAGPGNRMTLGNFNPRSTKKLMKSSKTAAETSTRVLGTKKNDFGTIAKSIDLSKKPRMIENVKIVEPFIVRVEKRRESNRIVDTSDIEIVDDFEPDTDSCCSSVDSAFSKCNTNVVDFSNQPIESLNEFVDKTTEINSSQSSPLKEISFHSNEGFKLTPHYVMLPEYKSQFTCLTQKDMKKKQKSSNERPALDSNEFFDKTTAFIDSEINLSQSSFLKESLRVESQLSSPGKISSHSTEGFKLAPHYVMLPEYKSPFIKEKNTREKKHDAADSDFSYDSEISQYSKMFTQPSSNSSDDLIKIGPQLSGLSKISSPLSEEFKLSPMSDCESPFQNTILSIQQSQYLHQRKSKKSNDATMFKFKLCDSVAREIGQSSQLPLDKSNSDTNLNVFNVEIKNTYNGCDSRQRKRKFRSEFSQTSNKVQSFVTKWLNNQNERYESGDSLPSKYSRLDKDEDMFTTKENLCPDPESLFSNYSCEYTETNFSRRFERMENVESNNNFDC